MTRGGDVSIFLRQQENHTMVSMHHLNQPENDKLPPSLCWVPPPNVLILPAQLHHPIHLPARKPAVVEHSLVFVYQEKWTQWKIYAIYRWGVLTIEFTCLYPCPTIRARNVVEVDVEMVLLSNVATSEIGWSVSMATAESTSTFEFSKKRAPWIYL